MDGAHTFVERHITNAAKKRLKYWPDYEEGFDPGGDSVSINRQVLRTIIGAVDQRLPPRIEYFGNPAERVTAYKGDGFRVTTVRWPVLDGVWGEGLLVSPTEKAVAAAIVIPDADQTPEQLLGMTEGVPADSQIARRLIANNVEVLIPILVSRQKLKTDDARLKRSDQTQREWLYRQAFHMGRHIVGYEVQKIQAAVDWLEVRHAQQQASHLRPRDPIRNIDLDDAEPLKVPPELRLSDLKYAVGLATGSQEPIGVAGYGEGALIAFYASAIDPRIDTTLVSGYFDSREDNWTQPIYRNVWSLLNRFGDAEIASLILPRKLIIEHSDAPTIVNHKGETKTPEFARVQREVARIRLPPRQRSARPCAW